MKKSIIRFLSLNMIFVLCIILHNYVHINMIEYDIKNHYDRIISASNEFYQHYVNTEVENKEAGIYTLSGEKHRDYDLSQGGFIVSKKSDVPNLNKYINLLYKDLTSFIDKDKIKTLSVVTPTASFFLPFYPEYVDLDEKFNLFDVAIEKVKINKKYSTDHNITITHDYIERYSNDHLRSIIMPVYVEKKLQAILMIDLKFGHMENYIKNYNAKNLTQYERRNQHNLFTRYITIPYTKNKLSNKVIGLNWNKILSISLSLAFVIELIAHLSIFIKKSLLSLIIKDSMTGCYRRNIFDFYYKNKSNKSLILLDIDHFKRINDQYGHDEGDKVIKYLAKNLNQLNSNSTRVFRWGGEEFLIVLPKLSKKALLNKAESIRTNLDYTLQDGSRVTISLGVTEQKREESIFQAIYRADIALYQSKFQGRNKSMYL
ncbi:GGDEF domain-containing protein [Photobacterium leiognathi]|uniref:GGDEF domain-containing protein n=1 Tax=Photobacterium leiognathi TaxID=553611 RepID=UPI000D153BFC|nr:GGDEF domain-containing protein [Photobacterium leiognathi]PSW57282.1 hypothetical protein C0W50_09060 [Photobacterium leiognathi subsp. mandapamensis]